MLRRLSPGHFVVPLVAVALTVLAPAPASAQLGVIEAFARRVTDLSFNASLGGLSPSSPEARGDAFDVRGFGLELLFEIGTVQEVTGPAPPARDSAELVWREMVVVAGPDGVDTTFVYDVVEPPPPSAPTREIWTFEMGIGYGQVTGFGSGDPTIDLRGQIRDLPSASLYANYVPAGFYLGLRSGFMALRGLRAYDTAGEAYSGIADSFLLAGLLGTSVEVMSLDVFAEAAYSIRSFPSVEWRAVSSGTSLPLNLPRELSLSGWSVAVGVQFAMGS